MKTLISILLLFVLFSCTKELEKVEKDQCPICGFPSCAEQLKSKTNIIRTQDNYFIWQESYLCSNCGVPYELYKKTKINY